MKFNEQINLAYGDEPVLEPDNGFSAVESGCQSLHFPCQYS